ncbi:hypothetical protein B0T24DRAFT_114153 [Lasiosphaeria ovina]|uniref:Zn(2)-C6 fungal-type domain-containing protein n=1 Tax=Lasiosphaeria ovina TaxID=92902 RepID=A0AAE0JT98_9PEZI|nr:hypothetical protein B0T24DRAFT_114153 [Lasiosphaeria ovina]
MSQASHHNALSQTQPRYQTLPPLPTPHAQYEQPSPPYTVASSHYSPNDHPDASPGKRRRISNDDHVEGGKETGQAKAAATGAKSNSRALLAALPGGGAGRAEGGDDDGDDDSGGRSRPVPPANPAASKSRRVRTGCLTCRERHLKCDEGMPDCNNCQKSNRECKRGVRLNFIDVQVKNPPYVPPRLEWSVKFQDESRLIASEYQGGIGRYLQLDRKTITPPREAEPDETRHRPSIPTGADDVVAPNDGPGGKDVGFPSRSRDPYFPSRVEQAATPAQHPGYDDGQLPQMRELLSRHSSSAFLTASAPTPATQAPSPGDAFLLNDAYGIKEESVPRTFSTNVDMSSTLPTLAPQTSSGSSMLQIRGSSGRGSTPEGSTTPNDKAAADRDYLSTNDEILFMRTFIEEVAVWMDILDKDKHFTNMTPNLALESPMLLNAFLACGVKQLTLVEDYNEEKAVYYYDTATTQLLRCLQNPDRNMDECATTAVVLNVYEIMTEKPTRRMSHIAGARALIRECGWNASTAGIGSACFWINIGMEVLSCLAYNWHTAWDPDQWGLDLSFTNWPSGNESRDDSGPNGDRRDSYARHMLETDGRGDEESWVHRILYIVAKISNFRANIPRFQEASPHDEQVRLQTRFAEWKRFKSMCDAWNNNCPRPMQPYGYAHSPSRKSLFPNVWLINRPAILGRLFYHTAMCLLAQINPINPRDSTENRAAQLHHARQVCGIVAHTEDRGVASVAIRSLTIASSVLTDRPEQDEVLAILNRINKATGWRLGGVVAELKKTWGWEVGAPLGLAPMSTLPPSRSSSSNTSAAASIPGGPPTFQFPMSHTQQQQQQYSNQHQHQTATSAGSSSSHHVAATLPPPNVHPLLMHADFAHQNHPYQNYYEPPNRNNQSRPHTHSLWSV